MTRRLLRFLPNALILGSCSDREPSKEDNMAATPSTMPPLVWRPRIFTLPDARGKTYSLA